MCVHCASRPDPMLGSWRCRAVEVVTLPGRRRRLGATHGYRRRMLEVARTLGVGDHHSGSLPSVSGSSRRGAAARRSIWSFGALPASAACHSENAWSIGDRVPCAVDTATCAKISRWSRAVLVHVALREHRYPARRRQQAVGDVPAPMDEIGRRDRCPPTPSL